MIGNKYGRLTVLDVYSVKTGNCSRTMCKCLCECGNTTSVRKYDLTHNITASCGCILKEQAKLKAKKMGISNRKHSLSGSRIYGIWDNMRRRCDNPKDKAYKNYGGRGITYDVKWSNFENFYKDMIDGYNSKMTLERIDVNKGYFKDNCCWKTMLEQQRNKRNTRYIFIDGKKIRICDAAKKYNLSVSTIVERLKRGWSYERCILPPQNRNQYSK